MDGKDMLLADFHHFSESMWRNEDVGEKRLAFFVSLATAVSAGVIALRTAAGGLDSATTRAISIAALTALLILGTLNYWRMLHRNRVTDEYIRTLRYIRECYKKLSPELGEYNVPRRSTTQPRIAVRGGYADTFGILNGVLLAALLHHADVLSRNTAIGVGAVVAAGLCWGASKRERWD